MIRNLLLFGIFTLCFFHLSRAQATTPSQLAAEAQVAYQAGEYSEAIRHWQDLISLGYRNGALFQNLGSAFWKQGEGGEARLYFLKALLWSPRNSAIRHNLRYINSTLKIEPAHVSTLFPNVSIPYYRIALNFPESLFLGAIGSFLLALSIFLRVRFSSKRPILLALSILLCFYAIPQLLFQTYLVYGTRNGVILKDQVDLLKLPSSQSPIVEKLREGTDIVFKKKQGEYGLVRLVSGQEGWVSLSAMGEI